MARILPVEFHACDSPMRLVTGFRIFVSILCTAINTCSFRHVIIHNADFVLLLALLRKDFPDLPSLTLDLSHAPNLLSGPCVGYALHQHLDNVALDAILCPARLEELVCIKICKLDNSRKRSSAMSTIVCHFSFL
jgi:hypothetical protein